MTSYAVGLGMKLFSSLACLALLTVALVPVACSDNENPNGSTPGAGDGGVDEGGEGGTVVPPQPAQAHPSKNPQPKVTECTRGALTPPASGTCGVTKPGTTGRVFQGTVLAPDEVLHRGEILVDDAGTILCAACDCSADAAYAAATIVTCANGVISPGFINPHEHITYQNNAPIAHPGLRYENRSDWQGGRGHARLDYKSGANQTVQAYGELRFLMAGTTTMAGGGGIPGLVRNIDTSADELEGLPAYPANSDVFPLSTPGKNLASGCDYSPGGTTNAAVSQLDSYLPHISEGIDVEARNEFVCTSAPPTDLIEPQTAIIHAVALNPVDAAIVRTNMSQGGLVAALERRPLRQHRERDDARPRRRQHRARHGLGAFWLDEHAPRARLRGLAQHDLLRQALHRRRPLAHGHRERGLRGRRPARRRHAQEGLPRGRRDLRRLDEQGFPRGHRGRRRGRRARPPRRQDHVRRRRRS